MKKNHDDYPGERRAALAAAARETVEGEGADGFSLPAVTRALGVDKGALLAAVATAGFDELGQLMASR